LLSVPLRRFAVLSSQVWGKNEKFVLELRTSSISELIPPARKKTTAGKSLLGKGVSERKGPERSDRSPFWVFFENGVSF